MGSKLAKLCVPENRRRRTLWSSVYRAMITLGERTQYYDIEHISLPFEPERERYIRERGGLGEDALPGFYENIYTSVRNGVKIADAIQADETSRARDVIVRYVHEESTDREDGGHDLYLLTAPMTRLLDSGYFRDGQISIAALARLGIRLSGTIRRVTDSGLHLGVLDFDPLCVATSETGAEIVTVTDLLYCREDGIHFPYPAVLPFNTPFQIRQGRPPTENTDIASLALALTAILNGTYGCPVPDVTALPAFIPEAVASGFADARAGSLTAKEFQKLMDEMRTRTENADDIILRVDCSEGYRPLPEPDIPDRDSSRPEEAKAPDPVIPDEGPPLLYEEAVYDLIFTDGQAETGPERTEQKRAEEPVEQRVRKGFLARLRSLFRNTSKGGDSASSRLTEGDTPIYVQAGDPVPQTKEPDEEETGPSETAFVPFGTGEILDRERNGRFGKDRTKEEET